jgi:hypothetical protein
LSARSLSPIEGKVRIGEGKKKRVPIENIRTSLFIKVCGVETGG